MPEKTDLSPREIDEIRAAAIIGVRHAMADVAAIRSEIKEICDSIFGPSPRTDRPDSVADNHTQACDDFSLT